MRFRKSNVLLLWLGGGLFFFGLLFVDGHFRKKADLQRIDAMAAAVRTLQLTDLCLFTEARYTRHLSQADLHSAFQDHPMSAEHFPAGSLTRPPKRTRHENLD